MAVSRLRSAPTGWPRHVGARTAWAAGLLAAYSVACAIGPELFGVAGLTWAIVFLYFWPVTAPALMLMTAVWLATRPTPIRGLAALQALGWWSLLVGVVGVGVAIALRDTAPLCLD